MSAAVVGHAAVDDGRIVVAATDVLWPQRAFPAAACIPGRGGLVLRAWRRGALEDNIDGMGEKTSGRGTGDQSRQGRDWSRGDGESVSRRGRVARRGLRVCGMGRVRVKPLSDEVWSEESHPLDLSEEEKGEFKVKSYPFI